MGISFWMCSDQDLRQWVWCVLMACSTMFHHGNSLQPWFWTCNLWALYVMPHNTKEPFWNPSALSPANVHCIEPHCFNSNYKVSYSYRSNRFKGEGIHHFLAPFISMWELYLLPCLLVSFFKIAVLFGYLDYIK